MSHWTSISWPANVTTFALQRIADGEQTLVDACTTVASLRPAVLLTLACFVVSLCMLFITQYVLAQVLPVARALREHTRSTHCCPTCQCARSTEAPRVVASPSNVGK